MDETGPAEREIKDIRENRPSKDSGGKDSFVGSIKKKLREIGRALDSDPDAAEKEIITMVNEGHEQGVFEASEARMISNIFEFGDKKAGDIMTHRKNILAIDSATPLIEAVKYMLGESKSRYPVYEGDIDHIVGIVHFKDAVRIKEASGEDVLNTPIGEVEGLIREARLIPETRHIDVLFRNMRSARLQMVIVIDEYGQCAGLVALEDILEEIVGNILDEYDEEELHIRKMAEDKYIIEGLTHLDEIEEVIPISFGENEFDTLNGFMISRMDKIPEAGDRFETQYEGYIFRVLSVKNRIVENVLVMKSND